MIASPLNKPAYQLPEGIENEDVLYNIIMKKLEDYLYSGKYLFGVDPATMKDAPITKLSKRNNDAETNSDN